MQECCGVETGSKKWDLSLNRILRLMWKAFIGSEWFKVLFTESAHHRHSIKAMKSLRLIGIFRQQTANSKKVIREIQNSHKSLQSIWNEKSKSSSLTIDFATYKPILITLSLPFFAAEDFDFWLMTRQQQNTSKHLLCVHRAPFKSIVQQLIDNHTRLNRSADRFQIKVSSFRN